MDVIIISWIIFGILVGAVANSVGRGFWTYFFLSLFFSPIVGFIVLAIKGKATQEEAIKNIKHIFYCSTCGDVYSSYGQKNEYCPTCNKLLMETTMPADEWRSLDNDKKESIKKAFADGEFSIDNKVTINKQNDINKNDPVEEIKKYKELLDAGIITQEEFDEKKRHLLNL